MDADNHDLERAQTEEDTESDAERRVPRRLVRVHFQGPLPPPSVLRQYDEVAPNAAERILRMAERRPNFATTSNAGMPDAPRWGSSPGAVFVLTALALSAYAFYLGQPLASLG